MADNPQLYGFRFHSTKSGSGTPHVVKKAVASGYAGQPDGATTVNINPGDVVKVVNDGTVALAAAGDTGLFGVVVGIAPYWDGSKMQRGSDLPSGTTYSTNISRQSYVHVIPFYDAIFEVDCDDAATATTFLAYQAFVGENCDLAVSCDATSKKSFYRLDISGHGTGSAQFRIWDVKQDGPNADFSGNYVKVLVVANETTAALAGYDSGASGT